MKSFIKIFIIVVLVFTSYTSSSQVIVRRGVTVVRAPYYRTIVVSPAVVFNPVPPIVITPVQKIVTPAPVYTEVIVNKTMYYYSEGIFYLKKEECYTKVNAPIGAIVSKLPDNCEKMVIEGTVYFKVNKVVYKQTKVAGKLSYQVVSIAG
ncbi:DUF6515 family protein [Zhouia sp. PK063]|uniref:DUF6515 family protein n=1 Tax=Zhouia sp. PK063 TaxID=3373602 RepID=UPI0037BB9F9E